MSSRNMLTREQAIQFIEVLRGYYPGTSPSEGQAELWGEGLSIFTFEECVAGLRAYSFEESRFPSLADLRKYAKAQKPAATYTTFQIDPSQVRQCDPGPEYIAARKEMDRKWAAKKASKGMERLGASLDDLIDGLAEKMKGKDNG